MTVLNFDGVADAQSTDYVLPGTIDVFEIENVEAGESSQKQTPFIKVKFITDKNASFSHNFYLVEKALSRIQHLWKHTNGEELAGNVTYEQLIHGLTGKKVALKITGRIGNNGKTYSDLPFGGFAANGTKEGVESLQFTGSEQLEIEKALDNKTKQSVDNADTETSGIAEADAF